FNLVLSARRHNVTMARYNTMSHQLPGEPYFGTRMTNAGYTWSWAGENIGWNSAMNTRGVVTLEKLMYNETAPNNSHRLNILNWHFRNVGVDVYLDKVHHKAWLTTDYGHH
ncbi:MAG TPA: CAP domain-containing protein, partial [Pseudonocardiaceae bacterium]